MKNLLHYILITTLIICFSQTTNAQYGPNTYGFEWINPNQQYYKFPITTDGVYKITKDKLREIGWENIPGSQFQLFNKGQEIPIYVTTNDTFGDNDYILFVGEKDNDFIDKFLYDTATFESKYKSIINDKNYYFITFTNAPVLRIYKQPNIQPTVLPTPAEYCYATVNTTAAQTTRSYGPSYSTSQNYYSSQYENGVGLIFPTTNNGSVNQTFNTRNRLLNNSIQNFIKFNIHNQTSSHSALTVKVNNNTILDTILPPYVSIKYVKELDGSLLNTTTSTVNYAYNFRNVITTSEIKYGRNFVFDGVFANFCKFQLSTSNSYLNTTFSSSTGEKGLLIDMTYHKIYESLTGTNNNNKRFFITDTIGERNYALVRETSINSITNNFIKVNSSYLNKISEGDYIILSTTNLINNDLRSFANYRQSNQGGNHIPTIINADSLYDLFSYGKDYHPYAIKSFYNYAKNLWSLKPKFIFIVGKGVLYNNITNYEAATNLRYKPIPTWGYPGSDNYFTSNDAKINPEIPVGRISVISETELSTYLNKVRLYESQVLNNINSITNNFWKKRVLHVAGASASAIQNTLIATLNSAKTIIEDTSLGMEVTTIYKRDTDPVSSVTDASIDSLINDGVRFITFYGHAGASGFDYNLNDPKNQNSKPKFPIFLAYGCEVGQVNALNNNRTATDDYLYAENGGAIAMVSSNNVGWTGTIPIYMLNLYRQFNLVDNYKTIGEAYINNIKSLASQIAINKYLEIHCQSLLLHGDPALQLNMATKPDYATESTHIKLVDSKVSTSMDDFKVSFDIYNLGKYQKDSVNILLEHFSNNVLRKTDTVKHIIKDKISFEHEFKINKLTDQGLNKIRINIDYDNHVDEIFEDNNIAELDFNITSDQIIPSYPYEFSITNNRNLELVATTADFFTSTKKMKFELDTTELFNSNSKVRFDTTSIGGVISWKPIINWSNKQVYYWRVALDTLINNEYQWKSSSFIFLDTISNGWNQSHYFQYKNDDYKLITLDENRQFKYDKVVNIYKSTNANIWDGRYKDAADYINDRELNSSNCQSNMNHGIQISVFNPITGEPLQRISPCAAHYSANEFQSNNVTGRRNALNFLKNIPDGYYVSIKNLVHGSGTSAAYVNNWANDSASGNSFYHYLRDSVGFTDIVNVTGTRVFCLFFQKNNPNYPLHSAYSTYSGELISIEADIITNVDSATVTSTPIGKAKKWDHFFWNTKTYDSLSANDKDFIQIYGGTLNNTLVPLAKVYGPDTTLSWIDANTYPYIQLVWNAIDTTDRSNAGLDYWRVHYTPVPEASLAPNLAFNISDTLNQGDINKFKIAIKNVSDYDMDSMLVQYRIIDNNNTSHNLDRIKYPPIPKNDSIIVNIDVNTDQFSGKNILFVEANPDNDQPEQYHPNNLGYFSFFVNKDDRNPLLDVTFDGVRILDKDIVSAKPFIKIQLNDENLAKPLNDTALFELYLAKPSNISNLQRIYVDGNILKFIPADISNGKNEAYLEYKPELNEDGIYKLVVKAKDASNNLAGNRSQYDVNFTVYNKSTITNVLNYPNPFSTSTSFIFTLTGSEIPSQFKIQILSVTGKVVREITRDEIGPIHIGRNMTEYKWDGRDQYGQLLGNGVYLYRVITSIKGENIEHSANQNVDKYFKNGYGKLYIMR